MISSYKVIFFDAGGTLFHPFPSVGEIYQRVAGRYGCEADAEQLEGSFREAWQKRDGLSSLVGHSSEKKERDWWHSLVLEVFSQMGGVDDFESLFAELYDVFARPESWRLYPEALEVLKALRQKGKILGVISNWDSRLFQLLGGLGLEEYFRLVLASGVFGASKPGPRIFQEGLRRLDVQPYEAVHVGDSLEDDVNGCRAVGMDAILVDRFEGARRKAVTRLKGLKTVRNLRELLC